MSVPAPAGPVVGVAEAEPLLSLSGVSVRYHLGRGDFVAVDNVSLDLARGERLVLLGPSGCGKSTLLRLVGGFLKPTAGTVVLRGHPVTGPGPDRMTVFQEFEQLLPWRTVAGNIAFALRRARGLSRTQAAARAGEWVRRVGLDGFADAYPHALSGGMKQRVAIARALAVQPDLLLMDEPFAALDALTRRRMQDELLALCQETGSTVLFVTHAIDEAIRVGTRIVALTPHPGRIAATFDVAPEQGPRGLAEFTRLEAQIQAVVMAGRGAHD